MKTKLDELLKTIGPIITDIQHNPGLIIKPMMIIFGVTIALVMAMSAVEIWHDWRLRKRGTLLEILPKETTTIKETEKLIKNLHGMLLTTKWRELLYGSPYISFEITATEGLMKFYMWVPEEIKDRIVDRIYATYSEVSIKPADGDYIPEKLSKKIFSYGAEMVLGYNYVFKIKTKADTDIIPSILSGMKDLNRGEINVVQMIIRPLDNKWQFKGRKALGQFERTGRRPGNGGAIFENINEGFSGAVSDIKKEFGNGGGTNFFSFGSESANRKTRSDRREITGASEKLFESGFQTVIRIGAIGSFKKGNKIRVKSIAAAFNELDQDNRFKKSYIPSQALLFDQLKKRKIHIQSKDNILTTSELANFFLRLPGTEVLDKFEDLESIKIKEFAPPKKVEYRFNILGENTYRGNTTKIGIKDRDLTRHIVIQGKTGSGKSEWVKGIFLETISNVKDEHGNIIRPGRGAMVLEPHGKLASEILEIIPEDRRKDVIVFDLFSEYPLPFNFCKVPKRDGSEMSYENLVQKTVDEAIEIFKRTFSDVWSEKNGFYIENAIKTIIDIGEGTMVEMPRLFSDKKYRNYAIKKIKDPKLKQFWVNNFAENKQGQIDPSVQSTVNSVEYKLEKFLSSKEMLRVVGQYDCIDFKDILDKNKIIIFKFSKDKMAKERIEFIGGIAMKLLIVGAFAREKSMWNTPFLVIVDEAQNFINESFKDIYYELRKYGVPLILMHQELEQLNKVPGLLNAIYNNVGTSITFTVGASDAQFFEKQYGPRVDQRDLKNLPSRYGYCKLLVDGQTSDTFNIYSMDSPSVSPEEAAKSMKEILEVNRTYNNVKLKSTAEIDEMLKERITEYMDLSELNDNGEVLSHILKLDTEVDEQEKVKDQKVNLDKDEMNDYANVKILEDYRKESSDVVNYENENMGTSDVSQEPENEFFRMIEEQKSELAVVETEEKEDANDAGEDLWAKAENEEKKAKRYEEGLKMIQESCGIKGKRKQARIDPDYISDTFVRDFPLTNFQREALEIIYNIRAVKIRQLMKITGYSYHYVLNQMLQLHLNRFVLRNIPKSSTTKGSEESYFLLDEAGAIYIAGSNDIPLKDIKWMGRDNLIRYDKLKHTFKIASVRAAIEEEARNQGHKVLECLADRHLFMEFKFDGKDYGLRPDLFLNYSDNEQMYTYFFEIDLGTVHAMGGLNTNSFDDKVASYENLKLSGEYEKKYSVFPRVLVITTTTKRAELLREAVKEKQKTRVEFLFTTFPLFEENPLGPIFKKTDGSFTKML